MVTENINKKKMLEVEGRAFLPVSFLSVHLVGPVPLS